MRQKSSSAASKWALAKFYRFQVLQGLPPPQQVMHVLIGVVLEAVVTTFIEAARIAVPQYGAGRAEGSDEFGFAGEASDVSRAAGYGID